MARREGFRTYVTSRPFGGFNIPVAVQNVFLRNYANAQGLVYMLPVNEFMFPNCYIQLEAALQEMEEIEGLLMCSYFMLPSDRMRRQRIYQRVFDSGSALHFAMEACAVASPGDEALIEDVLMVHEVLPACPASIAANLLPELPVSTIL